MTNTYSQIIVHAVFVARYRENLVACIDIFPVVYQNRAENHWQQKDGRSCAYPVRDTTYNGISDCMGVVKSCSNGWINEQQFVKERFNGSQGMEAFLMQKPKGCCN